MGRVVSVNRARPQTFTVGERKVRTGFFKKPVAGKVPVGPLGLEGDGVADRRFHGGPDKAVYAYPAEHYPWWAERLGRSLAYGAFGENLTLEGFREAELRLGDELAVGSTLVLQVRDIRVPCYKLAMAMERDDFVKLFADSLRCGFYLGVVRPGQVEAGDAVRLVASDLERDLVRDRFARKMKRPTSADS